MKLKKYANVRSVRDVRQVVLPRQNGQDIALTLRALPSSHYDETQQQLPSPQPPVLGVSRDKKNRVDRDPATGRPILLYNERDPEYLKQAAQAQILQTFKMIVDALDPDEVEFEVKRESCKDAAEYYQRCRAEMDAMGFGLGDYALLMQEIAQLSDMDEGDLAVAERNFSGTED